MKEIFSCYKFVNCPDELLNISKDKGRERDGRSSGKYCLGCARRAGDDVTVNNVSSKSMSEKLLLLCLAVVLRVRVIVANSKIRLLRYRS